MKHYYPSIYKEGSREEIRATSWAQDRDEEKRYMELILKVPDRPQLYQKPMGIWFETETAPYGRATVQGYNINGNSAVL